MTLGIYYDNNGECFFLPTVKKSEKKVLINQTHKAYQGLQGNKEFIQKIEENYFNYSLYLSQKKVKTLQTAGGSAALKIALELIKSINSSVRVWIGQPTWSHYNTLLKSTGLPYKFFSHIQSKLASNLDSFLKKQFHDIRAGDAVLLQGPCHNPTG